MATIIDPTRIYEINGEVCPLLSTPLLTLAVGNNQAVVSAVTAKKIRVMGWILSANAVATNPGVALKDGNAGTVLAGTILPAPEVKNDKLPIVDSGYFETTAGTGLYADITTATAKVQVFYIAYTP